VSVKLAKRLRNVQDNPNRPSARLRKDRCCSCRPAGGWAWRWFTEVKHALEWFTETIQ
jgi:hypothetical protein